MKLIVPEIKFEKKTKLLNKEDLVETKVYFPTEFCLQCWDKWVIIRISLLGFGVIFTWEI